MADSENHQNDVPFFLEHMIFIKIWCMRVNLWGCHGTSHDSYFFPFLTWVKKHGGTSINFGEVLIVINIGTAEFHEESASFFIFILQECIRFCLSFFLEFLLMHGRLLSKKKWLQTTKGIKRRMIATFFFFFIFFFFWR